MKKPIPVRTDQKFSEKIRAMKVGAHLYFKKANSGSIKSLACRIGLQEKRVYYTSKEEGGVNCWRES